MLRLEARFRCHVAGSGGAVAWVEAKDDLGLLLCQTRDENGSDMDGYH